MTTLYGYLLAVVAKTLLIYDRKKGSWDEEYHTIVLQLFQSYCLSTLPDGKLIVFAEKHPNRNY